MKKIIFFANAIALTVFLAACGNSEENADSTTADSTAVDSSEMMASDEPQEYISIPSPDEMFSFIKAVGGTGKSTSFLNNPNNYKNYVDTKSKALNFGIYATDFLYCSTFDYGTEGLKYFVNVKKLGDDLGISGAISESTADRIKKNIGKNDSLTDISNTLYYSAISEMEKSDKASLLSLVIAGGWIESMNIVTNMVKKFDAKDPAIERIAEQKYTLDNLIGYLDKYKSDANVAAVSNQLGELKVVYDQLKEETASGTVAAKNGKKVFGGGTSITITEEQYKAISEKVKNIHDSFTIPK
ncbi:MAG: hypothetical protein EPN85_13470 [Bacteroidetes bacterium]|nr:MAG: hypothetical protein EPN85_13470 [Bacteroidota bacterium]